MPELRRHGFLVRYATLLGGEVTSKACVFVAFAYLARVLGPQAFGSVELALSITTFVLLGVETGFGPYGARAVATDPDQIGDLVPAAAILRVGLAIAGYAAVLASSHWYGADLPVFALYGATLLLSPLNTQWVFQGLRQMHWVSAGNLLRYGTFAALVLVLVRAPTDVRRVATAEVIGAAALAILNAVLLFRRVAVRLLWRGVWSRAVDVFRRTWFLGAGDLAWAAMWYTPILIVGRMAAAEHVAWLAASIRIVMAIHAFVWLYFFNMVPNLSKELQEGLPAWRALIDRSLGLSTWAGCLIALSGMLLAPAMIPLVYGTRFAPAILPFQVAIWTIPVTWISGHFRFSLIVGGHQRLAFAAAMAGAATTVIAAIAGGWIAGATGGAAGLLLGAAVNAVVAAALMSRALAPVRFSAAAPGLAACGVAVALGLGASAWVGAVSGACLGCGVFLLTGLRLSGIRALRQA